MLSLSEAMHDEPYDHLRQLRCELISSVVMPVGQDFCHDALLELVPAPVSGHASYGCELND
jgi:hypothetical protein